MALDAGDGEYQAPRRGQRTRRSLGGLLDLRCCCSNCCRRLCWEAEGWGNRPSKRYQSYPSGALAVLEDVDYNVIAFLCLVDWSWSMFAVRIILEFRLLLRKLAARAGRGSFRMVVVFFYSTVLIKSVVFPDRYGE